MQKDRLRLASHFLLGNTIPGTRSFHHFEPLSNSSIGYKRTREDSGLTGIQYFSNDDHDDSNINGNDYTACKYDGRLWLGLVEEINKQHWAGSLCEIYASTTTIKCFFWQQKVNACWVPFQQILCEIATPTTVTRRSYSITPTECNAIVNAYTDKQWYSCWLRSDKLLFYNCNILFCSLLIFNWKLPSHWNYLWYHLRKMTLNWNVSVSLSTARLTVPYFYKSTQLH